MFHVARFGRPRRRKAATPSNAARKRCLYGLARTACGMYRIALDNGHEALGYTAGKMRRYRIKILIGDRIKLELSPYDLTRGRIVYRYRESDGNVAQPPV